MHTRPEVRVADLQIALRTLLHLRPCVPLPAERAASLPQPPPTHVAPDPGAWIAWCIAGLHLFDGPRLPPLRTALAETRRLITALAMLHSSANISRAAAILQTSRKVLRENLRAVHLYPWPSPVARGGVGVLR